MMVKRADHLAVQKELRVAREKIARLTLAPAQQPKPFKPPPYEMQVPVAPDLWVSIRATRALDEKQWDRLFGLLDLQRQISFAPSFERLIADDAGAPALLAQNERMEGTE